MNTIDSARLLQEMRSLAAQAGIDRAVGGVAVPQSPNTVQTFGKLIGTALREVNAQQLQAHELQSKVEMGDRSVSLVQAMIASQKANISMQATLQVRNRLVSAYQDIFNMPI